MQQPKSSGVFAALEEVAAELKAAEMAAILEETLPKEIPMQKPKNKKAAEMAALEETLPKEIPTKADDASAVNRLRGGATKATKATKSELAVKSAALARKAALYAKRYAAAAKKAAEHAAAEESALGGQHKQWQEGDLAELTGLTGPGARFNGRAGFLLEAPSELGIVDLALLDIEDGGTSAISDERVTVSVANLHDPFERDSEGSDEAVSAHDEAKFVESQFREEHDGAVVHVGDFMEISGLDGEDSWLNGRAGIVSSEESEGRVDLGLLYAEADGSPQLRLLEPIEKTVKVGVDHLLTREAYDGENEARWVASED